MPILALLFVGVIFNSLSWGQRGGHLRLQGPRLLILKLCQAELSEPVCSSSSESLPWLPPLPPPILPIGFLCSPGL